MTEAERQYDEILRYAHDHIAGYGAESRLASAFLTLAARPESVVPTGDAPADDKTEVDAALDAFENAAFQCGAWTDSENVEYAAVQADLAVTRATLCKAIKSQLTAARADREDAERLASAVEAIKPFMFDAAMEGETDYERAALNLWAALDAARRSQGAIGGEHGT